MFAKIQMNTEPTSLLAFFLQKPQQSIINRNSSPPHSSDPIRGQHDSFLLKNTTLGNYQQGSSLSFEH